MFESKLMTYEKWMTQNWVRHLHRRRSRSSGWSWLEPRSSAQLLLWLSDIFLSTELTWKSLDFKSTSRFQISWGKLFKVAQIWTLLKLELAVVYKDIDKEAKGLEKNQWRWKRLALLMRVRRKRGKKIHLEMNDVGSGFRGHRGPDPEARTSEGLTRPPGTGASPLSGTKGRDSSIWTRLRRGAFRVP